MRRRRGTGRKRFACNHFGKGQFCHRCDQAETLENLAKTNKSYVTNKNSPKPKKWTLKELMEEAGRLKKASYV